MRERYRYVLSRRGVISPIKGPSFDPLNQAEAGEAYLLAKKQLPKRNIEFKLKAVDRIGIDVTGEIIPSGTGIGGGC